MDAARNPLLAGLSAAAPSSIPHAMQGVVGDQARTEATSRRHEQLAAAGRRRDVTSAVAAGCTRVYGARRPRDGLIDT